MSESAIKLRSSFAPVVRKFSVLKLEMTPSPLLASSLMKLYVILRNETGFDLRLAHLCLPHCFVTFDSTVQHTSRTTQGCTNPLIPSSILVSVIRDSSATFPYNFDLALRMVLANREI